MFGFGIGGALHGEFVVEKDGGGYQTVATQRGEVTAVSKDSLTVKSEDGYSRTYTLTEDTLVNAARDGIDDVKTGNTVTVFATVADGKATAVSVNDGTVRDAARDKLGLQARPPLTASQPTARKVPGPRTGRARRLRAMSAHLLVVDDEPNIVELLSASLRFAGYDVSTAANGSEALRKAREVDPDLVVLDVMMPGLDGFDVVRRLRGRGPARAGAVPDRAGRGRGQGQGPADRRRRLRDQAVQPGRAGRPGPRAAAPVRAPRAGRDRTPRYCGTRTSS